MRQYYLYGSNRILDISCTILLLLHYAMRCILLYVYINKTSLLQLLISFVVSKKIISTISITFLLDFLYTIIYVVMSSICILSFIGYIIIYNSYDKCCKFRLRYSDDYNNDPDVRELLVI